MWTYQLIQGADKKMAQDLKFLNLEQTKPTSSGSKEIFQKKSSSYFLSPNIKSLGALINLITTINVFDYWNKSWYPYNDVVGIILRWKNFNYMLEIDTKKWLPERFGCPEGWLLRVWVSKRYPDPLLAKTIPNSSRCVVVVARNLWWEECLGGCVRITGVHKESHGSGRRHAPNPRPQTPASTTTPHSSYQ